MCHSPASSDSEESCSANYMSYLYSYFHFVVPHLHCFISRYVVVFWCIEATPINWADQRFHCISWSVTVISQPEWTLLDLLSDLPVLFDPHEAHRIPHSCLDSGDDIYFSLARSRDIRRKLKQNGIWLVKLLTRRWISCHQVRCDRWGQVIVLLSWLGCILTMWIVVNKWEGSTVQSF